VPIMFLGPNSYNTAPQELMFAAMKSTHLNMENEATGKR